MPLQSSLVTRHCGVSSYLLTAKAYDVWPWNTWQLKHHCILCRFPSFLINSWRDVGPAMISRRHLATDSARLMRAEAQNFAELGQTRGMNRIGQVQIGSCSPDRWWHESDQRCWRSELLRKSDAMPQGMDRAATGLAPAQALHRSGHE